jgi:MraZ protein
VDRFVPNFALRLDARGRVSILGGLEGFYCYPTTDRSALDAGGRALLAEIEAVIARFHLFSNERECLGAALDGTSDVLRIDPKGRVVLLEALTTHAGIKDAVVLVGLGNKFQIWDPNRAELAGATEQVQREAPEGPGGRE